MKRTAFCLRIELKRDLVTHRWSGKVYLEIAQELVSKLGQKLREILSDLLCAHVP